MSISTGFATSQLSVEVIIKILFQPNILSLTRSRSSSCHAMQLVNSVRQYTAVIEHCPDIIRTIVSIQVDAFNCVTLYKTSRTTQCFTCNHFGNSLYLIDCRRVCCFCLTERSEFFHITSHEACRFFTSNADQQKNPRSSSSWRNTKHPEPA